MDEITRYTPNTEKRFRAIICEVTFRECCHLMASSRHVIDPCFLPKGLHDIGSERMLASLQEQVDQVDPERYSHTLLAYGLCNNGVVGLEATRTPIVIPRAHDCITFFFGSKERYQEYFEANPGTYFETTGWQERNFLDPNQELPQQGGRPGSGNDKVGEGIMSQLGLNDTYADYVEKYGEENAKFILETTGDWVKNYSQFTYITMCVADDQRHQEAVRAEANKRGWRYEEVGGDISLLHKLFNGEWNDQEFLVVPVGKKLVAKHDGSIVGFE